MTEQATGKVAQLTPEEWKNLCVLNCVQLQNYLQGIPGNIETGAAGLTDQHLAIIDSHVVRSRSFMRAWSLSKVVMQPPAETTVQVETPAAPGNGAAEPTKKGGWPKGKPRTRKAATPAS